MQIDLQRIIDAIKALDLASNELLNGVRGAGTMGVAAAKCTGARIALESALSYTQVNVTEASDA